MSCSEMLTILSNPWANLGLIKKVANNCGKDSARHIRDSIIKQIRKDNKDIPYSKNIVVPTKMVIEYLGLDIEFIKEMALKEQELEYMKHYGCRLDGNISK